MVARLPCKPNMLGDAEHRVSYNAGSRNSGPNRRGVGVMHTTPLGL